MERPRFEYGDEVRVIRDLRNDGTYPGKARGALLVRRGATGVVHDIGTFLQDRIVYSVHFTKEDRLVGCRDGELIGADAPYVPNRFEFGDIVEAALTLGIADEIVAQPGNEGEVVKVLRDAPDAIAYHVRFPGRTFLVPETALQPKSTGDAAPDEEAGRVAGERHADIEVG
jgi:nitrogen fixation protein NifZ